MLVAPQTSREIYQGNMRADDSVISKSSQEVSNANVSIEGYSQSAL